MNWEKINIESVMKILRDMEKRDIMLGGEYAVSYSDGKEELKIIYKKIDEQESSYGKKH